MRYVLPLIFIFCLGCKSPENDVAIRMAFSSELSPDPQDGRLLLMFSRDSLQEPRFSISDDLQTAQIFGIDVQQLAADQWVPFDNTVLGYPRESLAELPAGTYFVQGLLNRYETFNLSSGHQVSLPPDRGEGQQWNRKPGNYYSKPFKIEIKEGGPPDITITLNEIVEEITPPQDTPYIKHIRIKSELLSEFWGRDMYLGAHVLLPHGYQEHVEARYPLMIFHGHFPDDFGGFRTQPPDPDLEPDYSERFGIHGYNRIVQQEAYSFYQQWTSDNFPRMLIIEIQHANPYYDDSYAVNSANLGPYGDAITYELIPYIEKEFRGIGQPWARFLYGGSTGGWEALAAQVFYPDQYNGCFAACPDPIDFRAYCLVNIYEDQNAYYYQSDFKSMLRPGHRDYLGQVNATLRDMNLRELVLGTRGRSGQQWDIWEAVYSPQGDDGYPQRLWDKYSGAIDRQVADYWQEHYDLRHILERDWASLGPKLQGKIHIYCGDMDNYYLNNAVYLMEEFLEQTKDPYYQGEVAYGDRAEHCWNGDPQNPNYISRLRYNTMYIPKILERIEASAPPGADLISWRY